MEALPKRLQTTVRPYKLLGITAKRVAKVRHTASVFVRDRIVANGPTVLIPAGDYGLGSWLTLQGGKGVSINLEGIIYRTGTAGGNMFMIRDTNDFEFYSANSKGAIQGYGYEFHKDNKYGPRLLRLYRCTDFSVHNIALVDCTSQQAPRRTVMDTGGGPANDKQLPRFT